jgi:hypothetical protein
LVQKQPLKTLKYFWFSLSILFLARKFWVTNTILSCRGRKNGCPQPLLIQLRHQDTWLSVQNLFKFLRRQVFSSHCAIIQASCAQERWIPWGHSTIPRTLLLLQALAQKNHTLYISHLLNIFSGSSSRQDNKRNSMVLSLASGSLQPFKKNM